ncbi:LysR family transcriptional regulator [Chachezhania sediminis]|uniref:LysR family transcriptional regulator n=1 Tax=Chachezhania sediminis TaxID=2599291 RepID=UPI00131A9683|nr:LysR family transcriptional regulator [Chachezhania sediminis]
MTIPPRSALADLRLLQTFESAARHGNFTRAGEELALTQSAVSRHIRELEAQVGQPLFERVRGRVVTTPAGEIFRQEVVALLHMAEVTMRHARAGAGERRLLSVNALPTFALRWLSPRLPAYLQDHPEIRLDLTTRTGMFDLVQARCDLAIHFGDPVWPGATCTYLCSEIMVPVAGGALRDRTVRTASDLLETPKLQLSERPGLWGDWFSRCGLEPPVGEDGHWFDQFTLKIEAAKAGLGYALVPRYLIEEELASGALRIVLDAPHSTSKAYYLVVPEGREAGVRPFCDWLIEQVQFRPLAR